MRMFHFLSCMPLFLGRINSITFFGFENLCGSTFMIFVIHITDDLVKTCDAEVVRYEMHQSARLKPFNFHGNRTCSALYHTLKVLSTGAEC